MPTVKYNRPELPEIPTLAALTGTKLRLQLIEESRQGESYALLGGDSVIATIKVRDFRDEDKVTIVIESTASRGELSSYANNDDHRAHVWIRKPCQTSN